MRRFHRLPHFPPQNVNLIAALAARNVEDTVALGRQFGMRYPKEYDVGFKLKEHPSFDGRCEITIRIGQTRHTYQDTWGVHDSKERAKAGAERFMENLQRQASIAVHKWADDNPAFAPDRETAAKIVDHVNKPEWQEAAAKRAAETTKDSKFTYPWGKLEDF